MSAPQILLIQPVQEEICKNLTFQEANQLRISLNLPTLKCSSLISDPDNQIFYVRFINEELIPIYQSIQEKGSTEIMKKAIEKNNIKIAQILLENGYPPDSFFPLGIDEFYSLVEYASLFGNLEIVKLLIQFQPSIDLNKRVGQEGPPLFSAALSGNSELLKFLLEAGAKPSSSEIASSIILEIVNQRNLEALKILLEAGYDPDASYSDNQTLLMIASKNGYLEIAKILLNFGANSFQVDDYGNTALSLAMENNHTDVVQLLRSQ